MEEELIGWQEGSYSRLLAVCAIAVLPVIVWFFRHRVSARTTLLGGYIICLFLQGSLDLLGFGSTLARLLYESVAIVFFLWAGNPKRKWPSFGWLLLFVGIATVSLVLPTSRTNIILYVLFLMQYLEVPLLFIAFVNSRFNRSEFDFITGLIIRLCLAQIFASIIKYFIVGVSEPYIGTMSVHEGGITTIFSLAAFACALCFYFTYQKSAYLWAAFGFVVFAIVGAKRASVFYIPMMYVITLLIYKYVGRGYTHIRRYVAVGILVIPVIFYFMARINPSFNPEYKVWGEFDLDYILHYSDSYLAGEMDENQVYQTVGRGNAFSFIHQHMNSGRFINFLFGNGAGELVQSGFNPNAILSGGSIEMYALSQYGVGYGLAPGYLRLLVQTGYLGAMAYILFWVGIFFELLRKGRRLYACRSSKNDRTLVLCSIACCFALIFIFVQYSHSSVLLNATGFALAWFIATGYRIVSPSLAK